MELGSASSKRRIPAAQKYDYTSRANTPVAASEAPGPKTSNASPRLSGKLASSTNESLDNRSGVSQNVANVEVGAQTYVAHFTGRREYALSRQGLKELPRVLDPDEHDVGLWRLYSVTGIGEARCEPAGAFVVLGEPVHVVLEGIEGGGSEDAGLAHAAAECFADAPRLPDRRLVPC